MIQRFHLVCREAREARVGWEKVEAGREEEGERGGGRSCAGAVRLVVRRILPPYLVAHQRRNVIFTDICVSAVA